MVPNKDFSFMTFDNDSDCQAATAVLNGIEYRKCVLEVSTRTHVTNDNGKRQHEDGDKCDDERGDKRQRPEGKSVDLPIKTAREAVSPWWDVPYEEQLIRKTQAMAKECLNKCLRDVKDTYFKWNRQAKFDNRPTIDMPSWMAETKNNELTWLDYRPIIASPEPNGYRNKCEFTFGIDSIDKQPSLGFRVSTFSQGVLVGSPQDCPNISKPMKILVNTIKEYLREKSTLKVYDMLTHTGLSYACFLQRRKSIYLLFL